MSVRVASHEALTILVPTHNRYTRLLRLLRYYRSCGAPWRLYLLDSSSDALEDPALRELLRLPCVAYTKDNPDVPPIRKLAEGLRAVRTPYVAVWADDDFLVPQVLDEAVRVLTKHPDVSIVHGRSGLFFQGSQEVRWVDPYPQFAIVDATASQRLRRYLACYSVTFYSVHRSEALSANLDAVSRHGLGAIYGWGEIALGCLSVIQGKVHMLDRLYMLREAHAGMNSWNDQKGKTWSCLDWLVDETFMSRFGTYQGFRDCLAQALAQQDGLGLDEAQQVVKQAFWSLFTKEIVQEVQSRAGRHGAAFGPRLHEIARHIPGLRRTWRAVRSVMPGQDTAISLDALRRSSSRYHEAFMPIYRAITQDTGSVWG